MKGKKNHLDLWFLILSALLVLIMLLDSAFLLSTGINRSMKGNESISTEVVSLEDGLDEIVSAKREEESPEVERVGDPILEEQSTIELLRSMIVPENDPIKLAKKYTRISDVPVHLQESPVLYQEGDSRKFWVLDVDINEYRNINAKLAVESPHVYFWVENGVKFKPEDAEDLVNYFERYIYPRNREIFGSEWNPGVDNDNHLTVLYAHQLGGAAGYFSSADSWMPEVTRYSNMAEMFYLSADSIDLHNQYAYGVLAHEFQHMIHWNVDRNETTWVNEGLSELAVDLNGLENGGFSYYFSFNPDLQLNFWPGHDQGDSIPHYGASYLFLKYLYDRFGQDFISEVVAEQANGWQGIENVLRKYHEENNFPAASHEQIFQDWTLANLLNGEETANNAYVYSDNDSVPFFGADTEIDCNDSSLVSSVEQFGTDYISVSCDDDYEVEIKWEEQVPLLPEKPYSGVNYYWSNRGSESVMRLAREFDLTDISSPIELSYWIWYDIEKDYDYMNVNISEDGKHWKMLEPPSCTRDDPTGANFGCGYNGTSDGWVQEKINMSEFSGKRVVIEFEYITDASVNGEGILLDDVSIDAIDYFDDFENNNGEWDADGFVRVENSLPQVLAFSMIEQDQELDVSKYIVEPGNDVFHFVENSDPEDDEIIAISGLTRYTRLPAQYEVIITKSNS